MGRESKKMAKKRAQVKIVYDLLGKYDQIVQVTLANVTSHQFKQIHTDVRKNRGQLIVLKNSLMRKACQFRAEGYEGVKAEKYAWAQEFVTKDEEKRPEFANLLPLLKQQCGYIFTNEPVFELKPRIEALTVPAAAKVGIEAQRDVFIPPGPTGMDPSQISFFHALQITTKIVKGQIEIQKEYQVAYVGKKMTASQVQLLKCMNVRPFTYGMKVIQMYDSGSILDNATCSISPDQILDQFKAGVNNITALSMATGYATELSIPHNIINSFKTLCALGTNIDFKFDALTAALSAGPAQSSAPAPAAGKKDAPKEAKKEEKPKEESEEEELDGGLDIFGDM